MRNLRSSGAYNGSDPKSTLMILLQSAQKLTSSDTPWMVCNRCIGLFSVNRSAASEAARRWRVTGHPSECPRLCDVYENGPNLVVEVVDDAGYRAAMNAVNTALESIAEILR
jgi:hypothetical protein